MTIYEWTESSVCYNRLYYFYTQKRKTKEKKRGKFIVYILTFNDLILWYISCLLVHLETSMEFDIILKLMSRTSTWFQTPKLLQCYICLQELHLHGNGIGNEGVRALMSGLSAHKGGPPFTIIDYLPGMLFSFLYFALSSPVHLLLVEYSSDMMVAL